MKYIIAIAFMISSCGWTPTNHITIMEESYCGAKIMSKYYDNIVDVKIQDGSLKRLTITSYEFYKYDLGDTVNCKQGKK